MNIKKFNIKEDYNRVIEFLSNEYKENKNMICWLPERFDDLIFRVDTLYRDERKLKASQDYIYIWEEDNEIIGLLIPDGDSFNSYIKNGYENIFNEMLDLGEKELVPLFKKNDDGNIIFLVVSHDSLKYQTDELIKRGYERAEEGDFDNVCHTLENNYKIELPEGFKQVYGESIEEIKKMNACHFGFKPQDDNGCLDGICKEGSLSYEGRKKSQFYKDSFESLIVTENGDICTYCFCYVNKKNKTAFIEPVCTREKYRRKGFCKQMLHGVINRLKQMNIENAYINSYDWRRKAYNSSGFETEDSIGFWYKKI